MIDCPTDCDKTKSHYCAWEKVILKEKRDKNETQTALNINRSGGSNREHRDNRDNRDDRDDRDQILEHTSFEENEDLNSKLWAAMEQLQKRFSMRDYERLVDELVSEYGGDYDNPGINAINGDNGRGYQGALKLLAEKIVIRGEKVSDPYAYLQTVLAQDSLKVLAYATKDLINPQQPKKPQQPKQQTKQKLGFVEAVTLICSELGIDYEAEFVGSQRKRDLYELHSNGKLTASAVLASYNSVREPLEKLLMATESNAY
jgi:hypothetical protein